MLFTIEGQALHAAKALPLNGRARFVELPLTGAMTPNAWLHASRFEKGGFLQQQSVVKVSGTDNALQVNVSHASEVVEPGDPQKARIDVKGAQGEVELMVSSVDEAIFAIEPDRSDLLSYFGRRPQQQWVTTAATQNQRSFRPVTNKGQQPAPESKSPDADDRVAENVAAPAPSAAPITEEARKSVSQLFAGGPAKKEESVAMRGKASTRDMELAAAKPGAPSDLGGAEPVKVRTNFSSSAGWFAQVPRSGPRKELELRVPDSLTRFRTLAVAMTHGRADGRGQGQLPHREAADGPPPGPALLHRAGRGDALGHRVQPAAGRRPPCASPSMLPASSPSSPPQHTVEVGPPEVTPASMSATAW